MSALALRAAALSRIRHRPTPRADSSYFLLGQNAQGLWVIRQMDGSKAGLFVSRKAALRFARLETSGAQFCVIHVPDGLSLDFALPA
jgi:hypothetical protein